jgi:hypothetical protein
MAGQEEKNPIGNFTAGRKVKAVWRLVEAELTPTSGMRKRTS